MKTITVKAPVLPGLPIYATIEPQYLSNSGADAVQLLSCVQSLMPGEHFYFWRNCRINVLTLRHEALSPEVLTYIGYRTAAITGHKK